MRGASFYQDQVWVDRQGNEHIIAEMELDHVRNLVAFLTRNAGNIQMAEEWRLMATEPRDPSDGVFWAFEGMYAELHQDPHKWLDSTPLMQALIQRAYGEPQQPWPPATRRLRKAPDRLWRRLLEAYEEPNGGLPYGLMPSMFGASHWHKGRRFGLIEAYAIATGLKRRKVAKMVEEAARALYEAEAEEVQS